MVLIDKFIIMVAVSGRVLSRQISRLQKATTNEAYYINWNNSCRAIDLDSHCVDYETRSDSIYQVLARPNRRTLQQGASKQAKG